MLQNAYFLAKTGADTAENEQHYAEILPKTGNQATASSKAARPSPSPSRRARAAAGPARRRAAAVAAAAAAAAATLPLQSRGLRSIAQSEILTPPEGKRFEVMQSGKLSQCSRVPIPRRVSLPH